MKRRQLLSTIGATFIGGLAGCSSPNSGSEPQSTLSTTEQDNNVSIQQTPPKTASYSVSASPLPEESPLDYAIESVSGGYSSEEKPLTIVLSIRNPTETTYYFGDSRQAFFVLQESEKHSYKLFPANSLTESNQTKTEENTYETFKYKNGCWMSTKFYGMSQNYVYEEIEPGETKTEEVILAVESQSICPEPNQEITFESEIRISQSAWANTKTTYPLTLTFKKDG